ncbi:hypothetical protein P9112_012953 [Eukaryota sp. TZLM1-RC]
MSLDISDWQQLSVWYLSHPTVKLSQDSLYLINMIFTKGTSKMKSDFFKYIWIGSSGNCSLRSKVLNLARESMNEQLITRLIAESTKLINSLLECIKGIECKRIRIFSHQLINHSFNGAPVFMCSAFLHWIYGTQNITKRELIVCLLLQCGRLMDSSCKSLWETVFSDLARSSTNHQLLDLTYSIALCNNPYLVKVFVDVFKHKKVPPRTIQKSKFESNLVMVCDLWRVGIRFDSLNQVLLRTLFLLAILLGDYTFSCCRHGRRPRSFTANAMQTIMQKEIIKEDSNWFICCEFE